MKPQAPFVHSKLQDAFLIYFNTCMDAGFCDLRAYIDNKELDGFSSVNPKTLAVVTIDQSRRVIHGQREFSTINPSNFKLVDVKKNELLVSWGDELD